MRNRDRYLIIVARNQPEICADLARDFAGDEQVQVFLDRRQGERRRYHAQRDEPNRRRADRRRPPSTDDDLCYRSFVVIRQ